MKKHHQKKYSNILNLKLIQSFLFCFIQSTPPSKASTGNKKVANGENNKTDVSTKQQQQVPARTENVEGKKQSKTGSTNKQQTSAKSTLTIQSKQSFISSSPSIVDGVTKVNTTNSNKKQPAVATSEVKNTPAVDDEDVNDQEDEGQWVTQNTKQVNNRNRNKGKTEILKTNNQTSSNRNVGSEKQSTTNNNNTSSVPTKTESNVEPTTITPPVKIQEPIEIYQLLPQNENRYKSDDKWWKQALNQKQTFSVNDIGDWPERDQDEQYTVQVKRIVPAKQVNDEQNENEL